MLFRSVNIVSKVMGYGAMGFIPKSSSSDDIANAINQILEGDCPRSQHNHHDFKHGTLQIGDSDQIAVTTSITTGTPFNADW